MKNVLLLSGEGNYGALPMHISQMSLGFKELNVNSFIVDFNKPGAGTELQAALQHKLDLIFSICAFGDLKVNGQSIGNFAKCPHIILHVDHPAHHARRFTEGARDISYLFIDRMHVHWMKAMFGEHYFPALDCLPPGGNSDEGIIETNMDDWTRNRNIPILFTGSLHLKRPNDWASCSNLSKKILDEALDTCLSTDGISVENVVGKILSERKIDDPGILLETFLSMGRLSFQVHTTRRWQLFQTLSKARLPVHIYGQNFEKQMYRFKSFQYGGEGSFAETLGLLRRSKIVLNSNTNFISGAHERVFAAMRGGATVITDRSKWFDDHFTTNEIISFDWSDLETLPDIFSELLRSPEKMYRIAEAGFQKAEQNHRWRDRCEWMLKWVAEVYNNPIKLSSRPTGLIQYGNFY